MALDGSKERPLNYSSSTTTKSQLSFEERRRVAGENERVLATMDVQKGIASFDNNMQRLGIGGDGASEKFTPIKGTGLEHQQQLETVVKKQKFHPRQNKVMMTELTAKRTSQLQAQKEREKRRRKNLADQKVASVEVRYCTIVFGIFLIILK